jgi:hypothetical protein
MITALRHGILVLLFPPLLIFGGILRLAYSRRNAFVNQTEENALPEAHAEDNSIEIPLYD